MANSNRINNSIESLLVDGSVSSNEVKISKHIVQFYKNLHSKQFNRRPKLDEHSFNFIDKVEVVGESA